MNQRSLLALALTAAVLLVGLAPAAHAELRVGDNFRLKSDPDPFRQKDALGLAVNPANPQHIVSIVTNYLDLRCEASVSRDGGETWSPAVGLAPPAATPAFDERCNFFQSVEFGSGQNVYAAVTAARVSPALPDSATLVYKSTNGGDTWSPGVVALMNGPGSTGPFNTNPSPGPSYSRPSIAVQAGAGAGGQDRVYVTALESTISGRTSAGGAVCAVSTCNRAIVAVSSDSGQTFPVQSAASPAATIVTDSPSKPAVNADGSVTLVWRTQGVEALLQSARSTDQGATWSAPKDIAKVLNTGTTVASRTTPGPSASASYPRMARDKTNGNLYLVYSQGSGGPNPPTAAGYDASDHFISPDSAVYLQRSTTMGQTWTAPRLVSDKTQYPGSRTVQTRHPSVSVGPAGRVDVVWHDRRHWFQGLLEHNCTHSHVFCEDVRLSDTYYSYSDDNGITFKGAGGVVGRNIRINDRSHNSDVGADTRPAGYWNYGPQAVPVGSGDGQRLLVGWMDSREGNWDTDTEDIYLAKVNHNASDADPKTFIDDSDGAIAKSVRLSKVGYLAGNEGALVGGTRDPANAGVGGPAGGPSSRNASAVVIVNENDLASAMTGTVLARANPAPVLLTGATDLPASVRDEITRLRPAAAYLVGDVSESVRLQVAAAAGILLAKVERLSGASPAATAALVAPKMDYRTAAEKTAVQPGFDAAVIANPTSPHTAAAVGLAAARRLPILYTTPDGATVPPETSSALTALAIRSALVIGNTDDVSSAVMTQMQALPEGAERLGGPDPVETSRAVVAESAETPAANPTGRGLPSNIVYVADAANPMDATLLGGVMARATGMLMLAAGPLYDTATAQASDFGLSSSRIDRFVILGPSSAPVVVTPPPVTVTPPPPADATPPPPPPAPAAVTPPPPPAANTAKPALSRISLTRRSFKARLGTSIRLTLSKDAKVRITVARRTIGRRIGRNCVALTPVTRRRAPCVRFVTRGTLTRSLKAGANTVRFTGRVAGRSLTPGRYRFTLRATDSANRRSNTISVSFTVVR